MIVSTDPKFIFLHIPKTAGTSVEESLYDFHDFNYSDEPHLELLQYYDDMEKEEFDSFFKFTVIRNPFNLLYSTWTYYVKNNGIDIDFNSWIKWRYRENYGKYRHLSRKSDPNFRLSFYINRYPQTLWLVNREGDFIIDHTICFERVEEEMSNLFDKLKLGDMYLPHENKSSFDDQVRYIEYYNEESIEIVKEEFKIDFDLFGYDEHQDEPVGGIWGSSFEGKKLSNFGYGVPKGIKLNIGTLPYGPQDIIHRYFGGRDKKDLFAEFTHNVLVRRKNSLMNDITNIEYGINKLQNRMKEQKLNDEQISDTISNILRLQERRMVYEQMVKQIIEKLESF